MRLNTKNNWRQVTATIFFIINTFTSPVFTMVDPDDIVKNNLDTLSTNITNATTIDALNEIEIAVNAAEAFFKDPNYDAGLAIVERLKGEITAKKTVLGGTGGGTGGAVDTLVDTVAPDINATIQPYISNLLKGTSIKIGTKTYTTKKFAEKVATLKKLADTYKTTTGINSTTQTKFYNAIKTVGGSYSFSKYNSKTFKTYYAKGNSAYKINAKKTKSTTDKKKLLALKNQIKSYVTAVKKTLVDFKNYTNMLKSALNSNLLTGAPTYDSKKKLTGYSGQKSNTYKMYFFAVSMVALEKISK